jgi:molybdate transport system substrate-binding protein
VSAASSLAPAFTEIAAEFERAHGGVPVDLNFGGSATLREQIVNGAPVDVFASANPETMAAVIAGLGLRVVPVTMATNTLTIAVPRGNRSGIQGLRDFADSARFIGLCAVSVPCGAYAQDVLARAGIIPAVDTYEPDVRSLVAKIALGEIDAGIVYRTDVLASRDALVEIPIAPEFNIIATYPIVALHDSLTAANAFVAFVRSSAGQDILRRHGFNTP